MKHMDQNGKTEQDNLLAAKAYGENVIGPVIYEYVTWILEYAAKMGLKTIYFLARDGYLLRQAAEILCKKKEYPIQCRYLYCSRMALRMPTYWFIGDEAFELLLQGGFHITPYVLMRRLELDLEERGRIYADTEITDENKPLTFEEYMRFVEAVKKSKIYRQLLRCKSLSAYDNTIRYLKQEGLFDQDQVAIADSGWSGRIQRSMRQLLEHAGFKGNVVGFYFGLYKEPKEAADGVYLAYYFTPLSGLKRKVYFDNIVFECMLAAPHGMTTGYVRDGEGWKPVLKQDMNEELSGRISEQIRGALGFIEGVSDYKDRFILEKSIKKSYKVLKRAILYPTGEELEAYCTFKFCDDVSESLSAALIQRDKLLLVKNDMLIPRIIAKLRKRNADSMDHAFWPFGLIRYIDDPAQLWYRWNIILLQYSRYFRMAVKEKTRI